MTSASPHTFVALGADLAQRLAVGEPAVVAVLRAAVGPDPAASADPAGPGGPGGTGGPVDPARQDAPVARLARALSLVLGAGARPHAIDPVAVATAVTVRVPGLPVLVGSDGIGDAPYNAARRFLSLDHLSGGRTGVVFRGAGAPAAQTAERIRVIRELWNSWPRETLLADRESGVFASTDGIRRVDHDGEHYRVAGPLNTPTSVQGEPVTAWLVETSEELRAARGLVDLVIASTPELEHEWAEASDAGDAPLPALVALTEVHSLRELEHALDAAPPGVGASARDASDPSRASARRGASATLRDRLGLAERRTDLTDRPLAFGGAR